MCLVIAYNNLLAKNGPVPDTGKFSKFGSNELIVICVLICTLSNLIGFEIDPMEVFFKAN
jgi:hypothetical protein